MAKRLTIEDIRQRLAGSDLSCVEEVYRYPHLKMSFECLNGHQINIAWAEIQNLIKQKSLLCPFCKHGENYGKDKLTKDNGEKTEYIATDGKVFLTQKELTEYNRVLKVQSSPHEYAIDYIVHNTKNAKKYQFKSNVIFAIAKWQVIGKLKNNGKLSNKEIPEESIIKKEVHRVVCLECDGDPALCQCNEGSDSEYTFVAEQLDPHIKFIPDLYAIDEANHIISIFEVEDTNRVSISKLIDYAIFADCLDWWFPEWEFNLYIYDRFGNRMGIINLPVYYQAGLFSDIAEKYNTILMECEANAPRIEGELLGYYKTATFSKY